MGVLLEEVVLDLPGIVDAQAIGQLHLIERVLEELKLAAGLPRPRELMLVEDAEFHRASVRRLCSWMSRAILGGGRRAVNGAHRARGILGRIHERKERRYGSRAAQWDRDRLRRERERPRRAPEPRLLGHAAHVGRAA